MVPFVTIAVFLLVGVVGPSPDDSTFVRQKVDMIELNHFVDDQGREVFQQVIFYDWSKSQHQYHVRAWRLIKHPSQLPQRFWSPRQFQCTWHEDGLLRQVYASSMRETWSQQDPERVNRQFLPEDQRLPLWGNKVANTDAVPARR